MPPPRTLKLNFNGASKGNLGLVGFGGATRNIGDQIQGLFWRYLGYYNNNTVDLEGSFIGISWDIK